MATEVSCKCCDDFDYCKKYNLHYCKKDGSKIEFNDLTSPVRLAKKCDCDYCPDLPGCMHGEVKFCHYDGKEPGWTDC